MTGKVNGHTPRPGALSTMPKIRRELSRVHRDMRTGARDASIGTKLTYTLIAMARLIESSDLETRLEALEETARNSHSGDFSASRT